MYFIAAGSQSLYPPYRIPDVKYKIQIVIFRPFTYMHRARVGRHRHVHNATNPSTGRAEARRIE